MRQNTGKTPTLLARFAASSQKRSDTVGEVGAGAGGSSRLVPTAPASGGSGRLRATWQGSKGEAVAFGMPVSGQLGEFANGIRSF